MDEIKVGDKVRSFDFPDRLTGMDDETGERACFVEGVVEAIGIEIEGCPRYKIRVSRRVWAGVDDPPEFLAKCDPYYYPPVNGTPTWLGEVTNGVRKVVE